MNTFQIGFKQVIYNLQLTLLVLAFSVGATFAAGEVDPTFNTAVQYTVYGTVNRFVPLPDGKVLIVGNFNVAGNTARSYIARLNADGTIDETFVPPEFFNTTGTTVLNLVNIYAVELQSDGKIVVGGEFNFIGTVPRTGAARLNADGSFDASFNPSFSRVPNPAGGTSLAVYDIKIQADNRIILGGNFGLRESPTGAVVRTHLARVNNDGSADLSFSANALNSVQTMVLQPDGKLIYADSTGIVRRVNTDGTLDNSFLGSSYTTVVRLVLQPDGKILVGGAFNKSITRLNTNGSVDTTFNPSGNGAAGTVRDMVVLPDGKILIGGTFIFYNGAVRPYLARLNADGTLDTTFDYTAGNISNVNALALNNDGSYLVGILTNENQLTNNKIIKINPNGTRDTSYVGDVFVTGRVARVVAQPDGKVLVGGLFAKVNGIARTNIARLNQNGSLDTTFNVVINGDIKSIAVQADGKILAVGEFSQVNGTPRISAVRLNADGSVDSSFQTSLTATVNQFDSKIYEAIPMPDGKILIAGRFKLAEYSFAANVARLNANGSTDTSFIVQPVNTVGIVRAMKIHTDGKIVVGGQFSQIAGANRGSIARLNADGSLDSTFNPSSGVENGYNIFDLAIQSNGSIVIGGDFIRVNGVANRFYLARLLPDGSLDAPFFTAVNNIVYAVERQADDKFLVGSFFNINGKRGIARFNTDGSLDNSFTGNGTNDIVRDIFIQSDNNILIGGDFTRVNNVPRVGVARLLNAAAPTARTPYDFDGDGKADISVFRLSNGVWYLQQSLNGFNGIQFGVSGDVITPADYDGDGKTDIAVFRPSNGVWYLQRSQLGFTGIAFGANGDIPMPGDYDGDGKADLAVFRPSNGVWYIQQSTAGFNGIAFGQNGDKPVAADYDGDGKTDLAVFRPSNGVWYIQRSQLGFTGIQFGLPDDKPVPADYDGDGKANVAVFRPSTGYWFTSTDPALNYGAVLFGANGDLPVPADYDGDGRADIAVFRPSNGVWYLQRSTQGFTGVLFGASEDKPIPNAFVR